MCDWICESVQGSHVQFFNFQDSLNLLQMPKTCRVCKVTIPLLFLQISDPYGIPMNL